MLDCMEMKVHCAYDELVPIDSLKAHAKNRNTHPKAQIERLAQILLYQGFRYPVKVSKLSGMVTSGHGRIEAARLNGWTHVPVNHQPYDDDIQEYADVQADNAIASWAELDLSGINTDIGDLGPDFDLDLLGIKGFTIDVAEKEEDPGGVGEPPAEPVTKPGDVILLGRHRLMCGDSTAITDLERLMNGQRADFLVTDPPYGISYQSNHRKEKFDVLENDDVILKEWVGCAQAFVNSWVIFFCGWQRLREWLEVGEQFGKLTNILIWRKSAAMGDLKGAFAPNYELALAYNRGGKLREGARPSAIFEQNIDAAETFEHPTQKPVALFKEIFQGLPNGSVLDLFGGSGTTLITCEQIDRTCFMMELDPGYCDVIINRWEKFTGLKAERLNGAETQAD